MNRSSALIFGIAIVVFAVAGTWIAWPPPPEAPPPPAVCDRLDDVQARLIKARAKLDQEQARLDALQAEDARLAGSAPVQPADLPDVLRPSGLTERLAAVLDRHDAWVSDVVCAEYPCLASLGWEGDVRSAPPDLVEAFSASGLGAPIGSQTVRVVDGRRVVAAAVALLPDDHDLTLGEELRIRRRVTAALRRQERLQRAGER